MKPNKINFVLDFKKNTFFFFLNSKPATISKSEKTEMTIIKSFKKDLRFLIKICFSEINFSS